MMNEKEYWDLFEKNPVMAMEKIFKENAELKAENDRLKEEIKRYKNV